MCLHETDLESTVPALCYGRGRLSQTGRAMAGCEKRWDAAAVEPVRRFAAPQFSVELLPKQSYETAYIAEHAAIGFAFERQCGVHAFASSRILPFQRPPNTLSCVPPGCDVYSTSTDGGEYLVVVPGLARSTFDLGPVDTRVDAAAIAAAYAIRRTLLRGTHCHEELEPHIYALCESVELASSRLRASRPSARSMTAARLRKLADYIDANLHRSLGVTELAAVVELSEGFFIRAFKAAIGKSPHDHLIDCRLARARALLAHSPYDLREVALASGFSSHAHMTRLFHARLGLAPSALRSGLARH